MVLQGRGRDGAWHGNDAENPGGTCYLELENLTFGRVVGLEQELYGIRLWQLFNIYVMEPHPKAGNAPLPTRYRLTVLIGFGRDVGGVGPRI